MSVKYHNCQIILFSALSVQGPTRQYCDCQAPDAWRHSTLDPVARLMSSVMRAAREFTRRTHSSSIAFVWLRGSCSLQAKTTKSHKLTRKKRTELVNLSVVAQ